MIVDTHVIMNLLMRTRRHSVGRYVIIGLSNGKYCSYSCWIHKMGYGYYITYSLTYRGIKDEQERRLILANWTPRLLRREILEAFERNYLKDIIRFVNDHERIFDASQRFEHFMLDCIDGGIQTASLDY